MGLGQIIFKINWVDILILIIFIRVSYVGYTRGLSSELLPLIASFAALVISINLHDKIGGFIASHTPLSAIPAKFLVYISIGSSILLVFGILSNILTGRVIKVQVATMYDSIFGLLFGILRGIVLVSFVVFALSLTPVNYIRESVKEKSLMGTRFMKIGPLIRERTMRIFRG